MLTHWIIGAGQIGCYLAACLQNQGEAIAVVARGPWKTRLEQGFTVSDYEGRTCTMKPATVVDDIQHANIGPDDWVWITVKCTGLETAIAGLAAKLGNANTVICCQNGVGAQQVAARVLNALGVRPQLLAAMVPFNAVWENKGLHRGSEGNLTVENPVDDDKRQRLAKIDCAMLPTRISDDIQATLWAKLQLNLGNAVNALANKPVKSMLEDRNYRLVIAAAMKELLAVCHAKQMTLPKVARIKGSLIPLVLSLPTFLFVRVASQMLKIDPTVKTSMWWDFHQGRETEVAFLQGAVVEEAKLHGIRTPINQWLLDEIRRCQQTAYENVSIEGNEMKQKIWKTLRD